MPAMAEEQERFTRLPRPAGSGAQAPPQWTTTAPLSCMESGGEGSRISRRAVVRERVQSAAVTRAELVTTGRPTAYCFC
jgi:hypothetical protein